MKKKLNKKLRLTKQTISNLNGITMRFIRGGYDPSVQQSCDPCETEAYTCPCTLETVNCCYSENCGGGGGGASGGNGRPGCLPTDTG